CLFAEDPDGIVLGLNLEIVFVDPGYLENGNQRVALLKQIDRRKCAGTCRAAAQPIAFETGVKRSLQIKQRVKPVIVWHRSYLLVRAPVGHRGGDRYRPSEPGGGRMVTKSMPGPGATQTCSHAEGGASHRPPTTVP